MMWICLHMNDGLSQEARKSANMDGERVTLARLGWPPNSCEGAGVSAHTWSEDVREGRNWDGSARQACRHYGVEGAC